MDRKVRVSILVLLDVIFINLALLLVLFIQGEGQIDYNLIRSYSRLAIIIIIGKITVFQRFSLYESLWEYASIEELIKVVVAVLLADLLSILYMHSMSFDLYPGIYFMAAVLEVAFVGGVRFSYRFVRRLKYGQSVILQNAEKRVLIIGCGSTASLIATQIKNHHESYGQLIGFIDNASHKIGQNIAGVKILGNYHDIYSVVNRYKVDEIIVAIPTAKKEDIREVLEECKRSSVKVRIVPGIMEIMNGQVSLNKIRDVEIEDLLGRDKVDLNIEEIASYIDDKTIMITGGGGSIGSELCRQIARFNPKKLIILDNYENNAYDIQNELLRHHSELNLEVLIATIRDRELIFDIMGKYAPQVIFHAAAHKHVPLMEKSPKEAIKNNVFGTMNVAEAAHKYGIERFILISTDKAVNPTNVMGASKRICELIIQGLAKESKTKFAAVRFGNVLGSNGSVIPLFKKQIKEGGPITITHREVIRYFMTIPEAAHLVIQAGAIANGGEVFVLDMGAPVKIYDLAVDLIRLSGLTPEDIKIKVTGLRPGEKLFEELLMAEEGLVETTYKKLHIGSPTEIDFKLLKRNLDMLNQELNNITDIEVREIIHMLVPTYTYAGIKARDKISETQIEQNIKPVTAIKAQ